MNHDLPESEDRWRTLLRRGDPAGDGGEPRAEEIAQLRRRVLAAAARPAAPAPRLRWAAAAAVLVVLALAALRVRQAPVATPSLAFGATTAATLAPARQVHFQTPGGTRIVWVLNPANDR
jgi:hypothetical protein